MIHPAIAVLCTLGVLLVGFLLLYKLALVIERDESLAGDEEPKCNNSND